MSAGGGVRERRDCPYFGLDYYDERWSEWFYGRDTEADRIITNLRATRLTLVHADSGVGKSSLLRAGVTARLRELARARRARGLQPRFLPVVFSRWQDDPLPVLIEEMEAAVRPFVDRDAMPRLPRDSLNKAIAAAAGAAHTTILLILDQFEEYFLYSAKEPTPQRLADELARAINDVNLPANFVIAIREDAYAGLGELFKGRVPNIYGNYLDIDYLTREEAAEAIRRPLLDVYNHQPGVEPVMIEDELVAAVIRQVPAQMGGDGSGGGAGGTGVTDNGNGHVAAPLLQLVMETIWNRERAEHSPVLRLKALEELEGVERIVDTHLAKALDSLGPDGKEVAVDAFHHLVTPSGGKIAQSVPDLATLTGHTEGVLAPVLQALDHARILRPVAPPPGRGDRHRRYEIFHDVLAQSINRVIQARQAERLKQEREEADRRAAAERARARRLRIVAIVACSLLVVAVGAGIWGFVEWQLAKQDNATANSRRLAASAQAMSSQNPELAARLALWAFRAAPTVEAKTALRQALPASQLTATLAPTSPQRSVAFTRDGSRLMTAGADGLIRIFDGQTYKLLTSFGDVGGLTGAAVSADGSRVVAAYADGTARVWNVHTKQAERVITAPDGYGFSTAAFSPDGTRVATAGADDAAQVWDVRTGRLLATATEPHVLHILLSVAFSPDGRHILAASSSGNALVWDAATGSLQRTLRQTTGLLDASFGAGGASVVTASGSGVARIWNAQTGAPPRVFQLPVLGDGYTPFMWSASLSPNGRRLVTGGSNGVTRIWDAGDPRSARSLGAAANGAVIATAFSANGSRIVTGNADGAVTVWSARGGRRLALLMPPSRSRAPLTDAIFRAGGDQAIVSSRLGSVTLWQRHAPSRSSRWPSWSQTGAIALPEDDAVVGLAVNRRGTVLATAAASGRVWMWSLPDGQPDGEIFAGNLMINAVGFDPKDQNLILAAGDDGCARLFFVSTSGQAGRKMCTPRARYAMTAAAFSPDGKQLITGDALGDAQVWDVASQKRIAAFTAGTTRVGSIAFAPHAAQVVISSGSFAAVYGTGPAHSPVAQIGTGTNIIRDAVYSPDGSTIATAATDATAQIWDAGSDQTVLTLGGHDGPVETAAFSPDGGRLITASADGTAKVWDTAPVAQTQLLPGTLSLVTGAFDPRNPEIVATAGNARASLVSTLTVWDRGDPVKPLAALALPSGGGAESAEFSADGRYLVASGGSESVEVYSVSQLLARRDRARPLVTLNANGSRCASSHTNGALAPGIDSAEFNADGSLVVTSDTDGSACVWNWHTRQALKLITEPGSGGVSNPLEGAAPMRWAEFNPARGDLVVTANQDGTARIWNWRTRARLKTLTDPSGEGVNDAFFSPHGQKVLTATDAGVAGLWSVASGEEIKQFSVPGRAQVFNVAFGDHGRWVMTCGSNGASIFDAESGRRLTDFPYGSTISDCEFSPDGRLVLAAGQSGETRIFSTEMARGIAHLRAIAPMLLTTQLTPAQRRQYGVG